MSVESISVEEQLPPESISVKLRPARQGGARLHAPGLVVRFAPIRGRTPKNVLAKRIWLPAILGTVTYTESALHNEYDTLSEGQFSQEAQGAPGVVTQLAELPLDTLTIAWKPKWLVVSGQSSLDVRRTLFRIMRSRKPVHLLGFFHPHPNASPEFDLNVTLRSASREIRPAEHDTHYISLQIKQWRDARVQEGTSRSQETITSRMKGVTLPTTKRLEAGDTLDSLSHDFYGTYSRWRLIRDANGISKRWGQKTPLVKLSQRFRIGSKIKIPALPHGGGGG